MRENKYNVSFSYFQGDVRRLVMSITDIPSIEGTYKPVPQEVDSLPSSFLETLIIDEGKDDYVLIDTSLNEISIIKIDDAHKRIEGTFRLLYKYDTRLGPKEDNFPDTMLFEQGHFSAWYRRL